MDKTTPPETKDKEGEEPVVVHPPPHNYDMARYENVVKLIKQYEDQCGGVRQLIRLRKKELEDQAETLDHLAKKVVLEADPTFCIEADICSPWLNLNLNLMGDSVLHVVINRRNTDLALRIIRLLKVTGAAKLHHPNYYGDTPLHIAARTGDIKVAKALLSSKDNKKLGETRNSKGETPLHLAVLYGHLEVFDSIIKVVGDEMAKNRTDDGSTIIHYAIMSDQPKVALDIARRFPDAIFTRNAAGATPLHIMVAFFKKSSELGFFRSLLVKHYGWVKAASTKVWKIDEESRRIKKANAGGWWSRLQGCLRKSWLSENIKKLWEEKSKNKMTMKLLKFLARPSNDNLEEKSFDFYFRGSHSIDGHKVSKMAGGAGDGENHMAEPTTEDGSSGTDDQPPSAVSTTVGKEKTMLRRLADELVSSIMSWAGSDTRAGRNAAMGELVKRAKRVLEEVSAEKDTKISEESPLITGVKLGLDDFVIKILKVCPQSATYVGSDGMNVLQAAVKYNRRNVVKAIKKDERLPSWLFAELESETKDNLLHIAASDMTLRKEAGPLRMQYELERFKWLKSNVPNYKELSNYRNKAEKTAQEVFDEKHEATLKACKAELADIGRTCSPLLAAVVFTSSFYIPAENNRDIDQLAFKIFSHVYVLGFSCAATSLVMFLLLAVKSFEQRDFRRMVPWIYRMAKYLLAMSLVAFFVSFACNMYLQIYGQQRKSSTDLLTLLLELLLLPLFCALALIRSRIH